MILAEDLERLVVRRASLTLSRPVAVNVQPAIETRPAARLRIVERYAYWSLPPFSSSLLRPHFTYPKLSPGPVWPGLFVARASAFL